MRRRSWLLPLVVTLAAANACAPAIAPAPLSVQAFGFAARKPRPTPGPAAIAATIAIDAAKTLHAASPYVLSYNRNHNHRQFATHAMDRTATLAALRRLRPRWGGSYVSALAAAGYPASSGPLLRTGHGPTDGRTDYAYMTGYFFQSAWDVDGMPASGDGYPYDDLRYTLKEAEEAGANLLVTVNFGTDSPESAGALADYLEHPASALRQARPFTAAPFALAASTPRGAFHFELGNELSLRQVRGHAERAPTIDAYVANARAYAQALRAASPHPLKLALDAATNIYWGAPDWAQRRAMIEGLLDAGKLHGVQFEALQYHGYPSYPVGERLAGNAYAERFFTSALLPALDARSAALEIWNDELHAAASTTRNPGLYGALFQADATVMALGLSHRGRQLVPIVTDFSSWHAGTNYDSLYFQDDNPAHLTPVYHFRRLLAAYFGDFVVETRLSGTGSWTDVGSNGEQTPVSNLSAVSALSAAGDALYVLVVNRSKGEDVTATLNLAGFTPTLADAQLHRIEAASQKRKPWDAAWNEVAVRENASVPLGKAVTFPHGSISLLVIR